MKSIKYFLIIAIAIVTVSCDSKKETSKINFNILQLNDVYEILTKGIFNLTPETNDSIGNDYIFIEDIWVGSNFLNVEFVYTGANKTHYINLVSESTKTYDDGKIHLEFRHNANGDYPSYNRWGVVSFDLKSLETTTSDKAELVIHTNEYDNGDNENTYAITYKYGLQAATNSIRKIRIGELKAVLQ